MDINFSVYSKNNKINVKLWGKHILTYPLDTHSFYCGLFDEEFCTFLTFNPSWDINYKFKEKKIKFIVNYEKKKKRNQQTFNLLPNKCYVINHIAFLNLKILNL